MFKVVHLFKISCNDKVTKTKREIVSNDDFANIVCVIIYTFNKDKDFSIYCFLINENNIV